MHPSDPYGPADDDLDELPELPIPRPGEWSPMAHGAQGPPPPLSPPRLGGGASYTASGAGDGDLADLDQTDASQAVDRRVSSQRVTWEIAAQLTAGMLANPSRGHSSVKDAMGLFDQFLHEMHAYARIASEFDLHGTEDERRRSHGEYFQGVRDDATTAPAPASTVSSTGPTAATPRLTPPVQPRPMGEYRPIPPGSRGPYAPGSMAGTPPTEPDEHAA